MTPPLRFPEGMNYACLRCGKSCEMFQSVPIDEAERARISALPWREALARRGAAAPPDFCEPIPSAPDRIRLLHQRPGPQCLFLCAEEGRPRQCDLHAAFGADSKPAACRAFPFQYTETPAGVFVGLSFACTAVLANHGDAVRKGHPGVASDLASNLPRRRALEKLFLAPGVPIAWDRYLEIEATLARMLEREDRPVPEALLAQSAWLRALRSGQGVSGAEEPSPCAPPSDPLFLLRRTKLAVGFALRAAARQDGEPAMGLALGREYLARTLSIPPPRPIRADWRRRELAPIAKAGTPSASLLRRYFLHAIFRKDLALHGDITRGHHLLLLRCGLILWAAEAIADAAGPSAAEESCVQEALRAVELRFGMHSTFGRVFDDHPALEGLLDSVFHWREAATEVPSRSSK